MLFETKEKADNFIKFNGDEIEEDSGFKPERSYFCIACNGWHLTHIKENWNLKSTTERILDFQRKQKEEKTLTKARKKEKNPLLLAVKKEEEKLIHTYKVEDLEKSLTKIEKYIATLQQPKDSKEKCIKMLNIAFRELKKAKSIGVVFKKSEKRIKEAEKELYNLLKKIEQIIVVYPRGKRERYSLQQTKNALEHLEYRLDRLEYLMEEEIKKEAEKQKTALEHEQKKEAERLKKEAEKQKALELEQKTKPLQECLHKLEQCVEILGNMDNLKNLEEYKDKYLEVLNRTFAELKKVKSFDIVFKNSEKRIKNAEEKLNYLSLTKKERIRYHKLSSSKIELEEHFIKAQKKVEKEALLFAQKKEKEALLRAQKRKEKALLLAQKAKDLTTSLDKIGQYIMFLQTPQQSNEKCTEIFNKAFVELEIAKCTGSFFPESKKRINAAEKKLNYLHKRKKWEINMEKEK